MDNLLDMTLYHVALYGHKSNTICQSPLCENSESAAQKQCFSESATQKQCFE
jgi:hypothetical protein